MQYISLYLETLLAEKGLAKNSILSYKRDLLDLGDYLNTKGKSELRVTTSDLEEYVVFLFNNDISARSINRKISTIKSYYSFLISENYTKFNPVIGIELPKFTQKLPNVLTQEEIQEIIKISSKNTTPKGLRLFAMISLLYASGIRVSELVNLPIKNIIMGNDSNRIRNSFNVLGKGGKERLVIINDKAKEILENYLKIRKLFYTKSSIAEGYFFSSSGKEGFITRQHFARQLKQIAQEANIDPNRVSPHSLRHSFASHLLAGGADLRVIQELLGHVDINTTQIYTHVESRHLSEVLKKFHPLEKN